MATVARQQDEISELFALHAEGRTIESFVVHGVNSLKSFDPSINELHGLTIQSLDFTSPTTFIVAAGQLRLAVDLQRTGGLRWSDSGVRWTIGSPSMPTAQLMLTAGCVDFVEPAKTKRITFRVSRA